MNSGLKSQASKIGGNRDGHLCGFQKKLRLKGVEFIVDVLGRGRSPRAPGGQPCRDHAACYSPSACGHSSTHGPALELVNCPVFLLALSAAAAPIQRSKMRVVVREGAANIWCDWLIWAILFICPLPAIAAPPTHSPSSKPRCHSAAVLRLMAAPAAAQAKCGLAAVIAADVVRADGCGH